MSEEVSNEAKALAVLGTMGEIAANVGMDEVVGVFVARWEDSLYKEKDRLSSEIRTVKKDMEQQDKAIVNQARLSTNQYETTVPALGIKSVVTDVGLRWNQTNVPYGEKKVVRPVVRYSVAIQNTDSSETSSNQIRKVFDHQVGEADVERHNNFESQLAELNSSLSEILVKIKGIGRKERQVRGRISEMKLQQAGFEDLINHPELVQLVELS